MKIYTVYARPDRLPILVKEAFAWGAFLFGPLWLLWQRAWIPAMLSIAALVLALIAPPPLRPVLAFSLFLLLGLTGRDLLRWSLSMRGYGIAHVVAGRNEDDAFLRLVAHDPALGRA
jgi:hypothetical protein